MPEETQEVGMRCGKQRRPVAGDKPRGKLREIAAIAFQCVAREPVLQPQRVAKLVKQAGFGLPHAQAATS
ncbi:hypothetical protein D3C83_07520 [compost metagenome]